MAIRNPIKITEIKIYDPHLKRLVELDDLKDKYSISICYGALVLGGCDSSGDYYELEIISCKING